MSMRREFINKSLSIRELPGRASDKQAGKSDVQSHRSRFYRTHGLPKDSNEAVLGSAPTADKTTLLQRRWEKQWSKNFDKLKKSYEKHIGYENFETRASREDRLRWLNNHLADAEMYFALAKNLYLKDDPVMHQYTGLYNTAMQKKGALDGQKKSRYKRLRQAFSTSDKPKPEDKYQLEGEYMTAVKEIVNFKKILPEKNPQWWQNYDLDRRVQDDKWDDTCNQIQTRINQANNSVKRSILYGFNKGQETNDFGTVCKALMDEAKATNDKADNSHAERKDKLKILDPIAHNIEDLQKTLKKYVDDIRDEIEESNKYLHRYNIPFLHGENVDAIETERRRIHGEAEKLYMRLDKKTPPPRNKSYPYTLEQIRDEIATEAGKLANAIEEQKKANGEDLEDQKPNDGSFEPSLSTGGTKTNRVPNGRRPHPRED